MGGIRLDSWREQFGFVRKERNVDSKALGETRNGINYACGTEI